MADSILVNRFKQAYNYRKGPRTKGPVSMITLHDMEAPEGPLTAENVTDWFAKSPAQGGPPSPASAHLNIDNNSINQSVHDNDIAFHAPGVNHCALGFEHAGVARQSRAEWLDAYSVATLTLSARLAADRSAFYGFHPIVRNAKDLKAGKLDGFTTHAFVSDAFHLSTHHDPGPGFPLDWYMALVIANLHPSTPKPPKLEVWYLSDGPDRGAIVLPRQGANPLLLSGPQLVEWQAKGYVVVPHAAVVFDRA